jgi:hypothetical protein
MKKSRLSDFFNRVMNLAFLSRLTRYETVLKSRSHLRGVNSSDQNNDSELEKEKGL